MRDFNSIQHRDSRRATRWLGGEDIIYYKGGKGASPGITIRAIIDRLPPELTIQGSQRPFTYTVRIKVPNDPVYGVDSATYDSGMDKFDVPMRQYSQEFTTLSATSEHAGVDGGFLYIYLK